VREAARAQVVDEFKARQGTLVSGIVKRVDRNGVFVDLGSNAEGFIARDQMIPREPVRSQDRIKAFLQDVRSEPRGPPTTYYEYTGRQARRRAAAISGQSRPRPR
jgi:N utilization substance protein A